ncbi:MAG: ABC transporter ATP-binding protein/permease [Clostridiales bacterium]|jgi:ABC-type multidrug transport system fused ATPase/permease subunit|nr:ABC transporter ATP-binding protein/permease [Clostridiales bacterium]
MLKQALRSITVMFKYAPAPTFTSLLTQFLQAAQPPLGVYFTGRLVNGISGYINGTALFNEIIIWAVLLIAILMFGESSNLISQLNSISCQKALQKGFTDVVLEKFKKLQYWCFEDKDTLDSLERMGTQPHERIYTLFHNTITAFGCLISLIGTAVVFTQVAIWFAIVYFILLAPMLWFDYKFTEAVQRLWNTEMPNWRRRTYLSALMADKNAEFELKLFGAVQFILKKWKKTADAFRHEYITTKLKSSKYGIFRDITLAVWAIFVILSLMTKLSHGTLSLGIFVACITSIGTILSLSSSMSSQFSQVSIDCIEMRHFDIFMSLPEVNDHPDSVKVISLKPHIKFDNVYFTYPKTEKPVLKGVSFDIRPGERVSLVGENGAGKSTIVKLLCGLYSPDSGNIYIDGISIVDLSLSQLRKVFGVVFQDYADYELTLRENVALGDIDKLHNDDAINDALARGLWCDVMPLDTNLGKMEADGIDLSGGQWQRIAVSRSLLSDSAFIILDEPTAALDPLAESRMYETFQNVLRQRGCIMISHRLASARLADRIIVISGGIATQIGTHDDLMSQDGLYRNMFTAQSSWYMEGKCQ